jgi:hypothetical protein
MSATRVVEPIDVLEYRRLGLTPSMPFLPPDQFRLQRFEERLGRRIVGTIAFAAHRRTQAVRGDVANGDTTKGRSHRPELQEDIPALGAQFITRQECQTIQLSAQRER